MPSNVLTKRFQSGEQSVVLGVIQQYIPLGQSEQAVQAFLDYYTRQGTFKELELCWKYVDKPRTFWQLHFDDSNALALLADRIFRTVANSVPCERSFSSMNTTHSITRNRLTPERVNKLLFIQINLRVLGRASHKVSDAAKGEAMDPDEIGAEIPLQMAVIEA
jgi:hypothetical protein